LGTNLIRPNIRMKLSDLKIETMRFRGEAYARAVHKDTYNVSAWYPVGLRGVVRAKYVAVLEVLNKLKRDGFTVILEDE
jgi:hypothetical protein